MAYLIWKRDVIMVMKTTHDDILMAEIIGLSQKAREGHLVPLEVIHGTLRSLSKPFLPNLTVQTILNCIILSPSEQVY
jgi:hypothetical protein